MNLEGIWVIKEMICFGDEGAYWRTAQDYLNDETMDDSLKQPLFCKYLFDTDGMFKVLAPIPPNVPKEEIEKAVAAGEVQLYDEKNMIVEQQAWKEENGKFYHDTGIQGEVLGEKVSPWMEIHETEDGIELMHYRLVKEG